MVFTKKIYIITVVLLHSPFVHCQTDNNDDNSNSTSFPFPPSFQQQEEDKENEDLENRSFSQSRENEDQLNVFDLQVTDDLSQRNSTLTTSTMKITSPTSPPAVLTSKTTFLITESKIQPKIRTQQADLPILQFEPFVPYHRTLLSQYNNYSTNSESSFQDRGMWVLYEVTDWFLNLIQPNDFPDYLIADEDLKSVTNLVHSLQHNHKKWIKYQQGFIIAAGICLLMALVFTICYFFYLCCCRCIFKETNEKLRDKRLDSCRRHCCNCILAVIVVIMTFTVVCAFISNHFVHIAVTNLPKNLRLTADDLTVYKDETNQRFKKLLIDDFRSLNQTFNLALKTAPNALLERMKQSTGVAALDKIASISDRSENLMRDLNAIENMLPDMEANSVHFKNNLTKIRLWVSDEMYKCLNGENQQHRDQCQTVLDVVSYSKNVPQKFAYTETSFGTLKQQLSKVATYQLSSKLYSAQRRFEDLKRQLEDAVVANKKTVVDHMKEFGKSLENAANNISRELQEIDISSIKIYVDQYEGDFLQYEFYRWIGGFVGAGVLTLLISCLGFGLMFGICGRRPGFYDGDCCVWTRGGRLYCGAVLLAVIFVLPLMSVTVLLFFAGGNGQTIVCRSLQNPVQPSGFLTILQRIIDVSKTNTDIRRDSVVHEILQQNTLSTIINGCAENNTLYRILALDKRYRFFNFKDARPEVYRYLVSYFEQANVLNVKPNFDEDFINSELESTLLDIHKINIPLIPLQLIDQFKTNSTLFDFDGRLRRLRDFTKSDNGELQVLLNQMIPSLIGLRKQYGDDLFRKFTFITGNLTSINANCANLTTEIPAWLVSVKNAQGLLTKSFATFLQNATRHVIKDVQLYFDTYFDRIVRQLDTDLTSCQPIQDVANSFVQFVCDDGLHPFNGFWACAAIVLLLIMPSIIMASALKDLYANTDPYVETDSYASVDANDRGDRVTAYLMTDGYSPVAHGNATVKSSNARNSAVTAWRTPANSMYFDDSNRPPPPYRSPPGRHK